LQQDNEETVVLCLQFPKVIPIGPLPLPNDFPSPGIGVVVDEISEENRTLMQWLDLQAPCSVLYIAFGTLVNDELERFQEIAFALESSKQSFLWLAGTSIKSPNVPSSHVSKLLPPGQDHPLLLSILELLWKNLKIQHSKH